MLLQLYNWYRRRKYKPAGTKEQRLKVYEEMYYEFLKMTSGELITGFCTIAGRVTYRFPEFECDGFLEQLPELYAYRPFRDIYNGWWFSRDETGLEIRKFILRTILKNHGIHVS